MLRPNELYSEELSFPVALWTAFALGLSAAGFLYLSSSEPIGSNPMPNGYYLGMGVFMALVTLAVFQFRRLNIVITLEAVTVSFGWFSYRIPFRNIVSIFIDGNPGIAYGGWGLRIAKTRGKLALVYSVLNAPRVVIERTGSRYGYFLFSTKKPEEILNIIRQQAGLV